MSVTLAELADLVGAKRRTLQLWAEAGVIEAEPGTLRSGKGAYRRYARKEVIIACLVYAFARRLQSPIGVLTDLGSMLRTQLHAADAAAKIDEAIEDPENQLFLIAHGDDSVPEAPVFSHMVTADRRKVELRLIGYDATEQLFHRGAFKLIIACAPNLERLRGLKTI